MANTFALDALTAIDSDQISLVHGTRFSEGTSLDFFELDTHRTSNPDHRLVGGRISLSDAFSLDSDILTNFRESDRLFVRDGEVDVFGDFRHADVVSREDTSMSETHQFTDQGHLGVIGRTGLAAATLDTET